VEGAQVQRQTIRSSSSPQLVVDADLIFRADATRLGYLERPRGLAEYYRAYGMLPPRYLAESIPRHEFTNFDLELIAEPRTA
jgi:hypothetical protein